MTTQSRSESPSKAQRRRERAARWQEYQKAKDAYDSLTFPEFLRWVADGRPSLEMSWDWLDVEVKP